MVLQSSYLRKILYSLPHFVYVRLILFFQRMMGVYMKKRHWLASAAVLVLGQLPIDRPLPASSDCLVHLPLQNPRAIALGDSFYLPKAAGGESCPSSLAWQIVSAPEASQNRVYNTGSEHPRFTPDQPGTYQFTTAASSSLVEIKVSERSSAERFRNHYLTPLYGAALIAQDLWTANGPSYTVTRVAVQADGQLQKTAEIKVGSWPAAIVGNERYPYVLVAQRGADTIGFINPERNVLEDALWVGDEPTGLALSADGKTLYVSLATERAVAVVDLASRTLRNRIKVGFDPRALVLSKDGSALFVASYRSANLSYGPNASRPAADDQDIFVIDTQSEKLVRSIGTVAADLRAMALSPEGDKLYIAATDGQTLPSQADPTAKPFTHLVATIAVAIKPDGTPQSMELTDLTRQAGSLGPLVNPSGVLAQDDQLWVAAESSDQVAILDRKTMQEKIRIPVGSGPRQLVLLKDAVAVHCFQSFELYILNFDGSLRQIVKLAEDPRSPAIALGEKVFVRPGLNYASNHSCTSCHIEAQNDGMIWRFGPNVYHNVRPLQLLAATSSLGWTNYVANAESFGFMGPTSILNRPPTNTEAAGLSAFLSSLIGAPRATGQTQLDGSFSREGLKGKALFEGRANCVSCHTPPLYTNRRLIAKGKSGEPADVPSLLGAYRHGVYFVKGQGRSLEEAVDVATNYVGVTVDASEKAALVRFLNELTPKGSHPLGMWPDLDTNDMITPTAQPYVEFAEAVDDTNPHVSAQEFAKKYLSLEDSSGQQIASEILLQAGRLVLVPLVPMNAGERYTFRARAGLPFRDGGILEADRISSFTVARPAQAVLPKDLILKVKVPMPGPTMPPPLMEVPLSLIITGEDSNGRIAKLDLGGGRSQTLRLYQDGERIRLQSFALPFAGGPGGSTLADASAVSGVLILDATDGAVFRKAQGTLTIGAPGISVPRVAWTLEAAVTAQVAN